MRISELIEQLRLVQSLHGNVHIVARNRDGDAGRPRITSTTIMKSGNKRTTQQWEVTTSTPRYDVP